MRIVDFRCLLMQPRNTEDMDSIFLNINFWSGAFHRPGCQRWKCISKYTKSIYSNSISHPIYKQNESLKILKNQKKCFVWSKISHNKPVVALNLIIIASQRYLKTLSLF